MASNENNNQYKSAEDSRSDDDEDDVPRWEHPSWAGQTQRSAVVHPVLRRTVAALNINANLVDGISVLFAAPAHLDVTAVDYFQQVTTITNSLNNLHIQQKPLDIVPVEGILNESSTVCVENMDHSVSTNIDQDQAEKSYFGIPHDFAGEYRWSCLNTEDSLQQENKHIELPVPEFTFKVPTHPAPRKRKAYKRNDELPDDALQRIVSNCLSQRGADEIRNIMSEYFSSDDEISPKKQKLEGDRVVYFPQTIREIDQVLFTWYQVKFPFQCESCDLRFVNQANLWIHLKNHHGAKYWCYQCGMCFDNSITFMEHFSLHDLSESVDNFSCSLCNSNFNNKYSLREHLKNSHNLIIFPSKL